MTELNTAKSSLHDLFGCLFTINAKMKTGLRRYISMAPAIQDDSRDISLCVKPTCGEHLGHLSDDLSFIFAVRFTKKLSTTQ